MKKCMIYCRVSTQMQEDKDSLKSQLEECRAYAEAKGYQIIDALSDVESGTNDDRREYLKLKEYIELKAFDILIVYETSRISRKILELLMFFESLGQMGIEFKSIKEPTFDTTTPEGKLNMSIRLSMIQFERDNTARRVTDRMYFKASKGEWVCGSPPFGYLVGENKRLIPHDEEAAEVKAYFEMYLQGYSAIHIEKHFNRGLWGGKIILRCLQNPAYAGIIRYGHRKKNKLKEPLYVRNSHPAIISEDMFNEVQVLIKSRNRPRGPRQGRLLSGLLYCRKCGGKIWDLSSLTTSYKNYPHYGCSTRIKYKKKFSSITCSNKNIRCDTLQNAVVQELILYIEHELEEFGGHIFSIESTRKNLKKKLEQTEKKKQKLLELSINDLIDVKTHKARLEPLNAESELIERQLKALDDSAKNQASISRKEKLLQVLKNIENEDMETVKNLLNIMIDKIIVERNDGSKKDDFSLEIHLKI